MTWRAFSADPPEGARLYLDTSAIYSLTHLEGWRTGQAGGSTAAWVKEKERARGESVEELLKRLASRRGSAFVSLLHFEELAAATANALRRTAASSAGVQDWREFKRNRPVDAEKEARLISERTTKLLAAAHNAILKHSVSLTHHCVLEGQEASRTLELKLAHRAMLKKYPNLDSMDALHIVLGIDMKFSLFVTLDGGWTTVSEVGGYSLYFPQGRAPLAGP